MPIGMKVCVMVELCPGTNFSSFRGDIFRGHQMRGEQRGSDGPFLACVRVRWFPCGTYVNFYGLARVAIQGLTWVNF